MPSLRGFMLPFNLTVLQVFAGVLLKKKKTWSSFSPGSCDAPQDHCKSRPPHGSVPGGLGTEALGTGIGVSSLWTYGLVFVFFPSLALWLNPWNLEGR